MREYSAGDVVVSKAGHDKGLFLVIGEEAGLLLLANGKQRPLGKPKRKKPMHIAPSGLPRIEVPENDKRLRAALAKAKCDNISGGYGV
jgi:hypothetical protein